MKPNIEGSSSVGNQISRVQSRRSQRALLTIEDAAKLVGQTEKTILRWIITGTLTSFGDLEGRCIREPDLVEAWSQEQSRRAREANQLFAGGSGRVIDTTKHYPVGDLLPIDEVARKLGITRGKILHLIRTGEVRTTEHRGMPYIRINDVKRATTKPKRIKPKRTSRSSSSRHERAQRGLQHKPPKAAKKRQRRQVSKEHVRIDLCQAMTVQQVSALLNITEPELAQLIDQGHIPVLTRGNTQAIRPIDVIEAERCYYDRVRRMLDTHKAERQMRVPIARARSPRIQSSRIAKDQYRVSDNIVQPGRVAPHMWRELEILAEKERLTGRDLQRWAYLRNMLSQIDPEGYEARLNARQA